MSILKLINILASVSLTIAGVLAMLSGNTINGLLLLSLGLQYRLMLDVNDLKEQLNASNRQQTNQGS